MTPRFLVEAVYYFLEPEHIAVIAVAHSRRHPRRWQSRR